MIWKVVVVAVLLGCGVACAQDMREVSEPKIPPVCMKLEAHIDAAPDANGGHVREQDEQRYDTERIQKALDGCGPGKAVELASGGGALNATVSNAFLSGPLELRDGVTLLVDRGVTLYGSRDPKVYEMRLPGEPADTPIKCGTSMPRPAAFPVQLAGNARARRGGCRSLISIDNVKNAAIMGEGTIDGRGYATILGKDYSWWQMARKAQPNDDLYFNPRLITASHADGLVLYGIHLNNSPNFHVGVGNTNGFTAWGVHLDTPVDKKLVGTGNDARNTDGIDPGTSKNITVAHSWIDNGDDNIAVKQGVTHMSVLDNHFYDGHGMSIGSETVLGQSYLLVDGLVEDHTSSGIRIKSNVMRGGPAHDLTYENVCMKDVPVPIAISPYYTNQTTEPFENPNYKGDKIPDYKSITLKNIYAETPGDVLIAGLDDAHRTEVTLQNVYIKGLKASQVHLFYDDLTVVAPGTNIPLAGHASVRLSGAASGAEHEADPCAGKFVPMR